MTTTTTCATETANELAADAYESIRALNHATLAGGPVPPPDAYEVLGTLTSLAHGLAQALRQLSSGLAGSVAVYALYEDDGGNPEESICYAMEALRAGAESATALGSLIEAAQEDISRTGIHPTVQVQP